MPRLTHKRVSLLIFHGNWRTFTTTISYIVCLLLACEKFPSRLLAEKGACGQAGARPFFVQIPTPFQHTQ